MIPAKLEAPTLRVSSYEITKNQVAAEVDPDIIEELKE
ncbi:uncharacterized protein G2W53_026576 [Senna tora]|uniref:Uncharacterized protein n=1 Tax=Senna tora TaxID=362788 RepID=A0A834WIY4_9FABA|nr:uncharacterized protein G2W53_026576 [Senna tora]